MSELPAGWTTATIAGVVEDLQFTHAKVGRVALAGIADGEAVVAAGRQFDLQPRDEIGEFLLRVDRAAFLQLPHDRAVLHLIFLHRAGPAFEIFAVKNALEPFRIFSAQAPVRLQAADLADE